MQGAAGVCAALHGVSWVLSVASGAAALVGVALCYPSTPVPWSTEAHSLWGWRDLLFLSFSVSVAGSAGCGETGSYAVP